MTVVATALLFASANQCTSLSGFSECMSWKGRGEMTCMSVPTLSSTFAMWLCTAPRIESSDAAVLPLPWAPRAASSPDL